MPHLPLTLKHLLLGLALLALPVFTYLFWPTTPHTLSLLPKTFQEAGTQVKQDFESIPSLPLTEEKDTYTLTDNTSDGIDIQFANNEKTLATDTNTSLTLSFPKDYSQPLAVKLDDQKTITITDLSGTKDYTVDTLSQAEPSGTAPTLEGQDQNQGFFKRLFSLRSSTPKQPESYLRYISKDKRKSLLYAYQKDQASGEKKLKHWTLYQKGDGIEQEQYQIDNAKVHIDDQGVAQVYFYTDQDLKNDQAVAEVDSNLMARAQRTLAKEMGDDIMNGTSGKTPDFTIPKPYYYDNQGEKHEAEWKYNQDTSILSVNFTPESYPVALDPTLSFTAPSQSNTGDVITGETGSSFGYAMTAGDFNADGKIDLAVGANGYSSSTGRVYIFYNDGAITTNAATADAVITGASSSDQFGYALTAGDFNSDGKTDLVVGADRYDNGLNTGRAYIFYNDGSIPTTAATADVIITGNASDDRFGSAFGVGDFNADGRTDLAVGAYGYSGGGSAGRAYIFYNDGSIPTTAATADVIITGETNSNYFGISLISGDFNADGKTDLAIGAYFYSSGVGRAYIFYNDGSIPTTAATADVIITGEASSYFGWALTSGDFNADGKTDLAVGARAYSSNTGRAYIFYNDGSIPTTAATADVIITGEATSNNFSWSLVSGDFNADGRIDLAVGAYQYSSAIGRAYIFYNDGSMPTTAATADVIITGEATSSSFGRYVFSGDFNSDGKVDLAVGASGFASSTGRVYIFYSQNGQVNTNFTITSEAANQDWFGSAFATGDFNSDGRTDLAVGAYAYNSSDAGRVYIFYGDGQIPSVAASADVIISNADTGGFFGWALAAGDFNADGTTDLAVSATGYSTSTGRVYLFYNDGSIPTTAATADVIITGESTSNYFGYALAAGDFNADGETDLAVGAYGYSTNDGRVYIFHNGAITTENASGADVTIDSSSADFYIGKELIAGDVNADGRADLITIGHSLGGGHSYAYLFYNDGSLPTTTGTADVSVDDSGTSALTGMAVGDFNSDGRLDLALGAGVQNRVSILYNDGSYPALLSSSDITITGDASSFFGYSLVSGDFNADGRTDLTAGAYGHTTNTGKAYIFYNDGSIPTTVATADVTITGGTTGSAFGYAFAMGDFNADGRTDLVVGAPWYSSYNGQIYFYETRENFAWKLQKQSQPSSGALRTGLNTSGQELKITGEASSSFGSSLATGDLNNDGKPDLIVGANSYSSNTGRVYVFYSDGSLATGATNADIIITSEGGFFGGSITGDFNSDGRIDLVVNAYAYGSGTGRVYIFYNDGSFPATAATADVTITGEANSQFGGLVTGDFNADGTIDLVVGANYYSANYTGRAYVFYNDGSIPTTAAGADVIITGEGTGNNFSASLAAGDFNSDGKTDLAVGALDVAKAYIFYNGSIITENASGADVIIVGAQKFGAALAAGDFNADGRTDLAVSNTESASSAAGIVFLFYNDGSIPTTSGTADVTITESSSSQFFGVSLAVGDWNADGRTDLAAGAYGYSTNTGRAFIFYNDGSYPSAPSSADVTLTGEATSNNYGIALASGDFNADGRTDLAVGASGYSSNAGRVYIYTLKNDVVITGEATNNSFGVSLTSGDFNADGKTDLAVGAYGYSTSTGRVYLFYSDGSIPTTAATADVTITGNAASDSFGRALIAGDFDGSGTTDLAVGAPGYSSSTGRVYLFYSDGSIPTTAATADVTITGNATSDSFGFSLASGDLTSTNAYGRDDLAIGAYGYSSETGRVYIFNNDGSLPTTAATADVTITGAASNNRFGYKIVTGDLDSNGAVDLIVGTDSFNGYTDRAYIFYNDGSIPTTAGTADVTLTGVSQTNFGVSLVTGDFNADGRTDLAVGATYTSSFAGSAYLFYNDGSLPTTAATADVTITGEATNNYFGINLAAGDLNADGRTDIVIGARGYSSDTGRAYIFYNDGSFPATAATADVVITGQTTSSYFGFGLGVGDFNTDGKTDLAVGAYGYSTNTGRVYLFSSEVAAASAVQDVSARSRGTVKTRGTLKIR